MADRFSLDGIQDLFREDVLRLVEGMRSKLDTLLSNPRDHVALNGLRALGHSLKGTAALVGLTHLSHTGTLIERVAEIAGANAHSDIGEALTLLRNIQQGVPFIARLLDNALAGSDPEAQENLYTELLMTFSPRVRGYLSSTNSLVETAAASAATPSTDEEWDKELAQIFDSELCEALDQVADLATSLSTAASWPTACAQLERIFHTLEGSAATVGREDVSALAKSLQARFGGAAEQPDQQRVAVPFIEATQTELNRLFRMAGRQAPRLSPPLAAEPLPQMTELERELFDAFVIDASEAIEACEKLLLELEQQPHDHSRLHALMRRFHTLKGAAAAVGLDEIAGQLHHGESLLDAVLDHEVAVDAARLVDFLLALTDSVTALVNRTRGIRDDGHRVLPNVASAIAALTSAPPAAMVAAAPDIVTSEAGERGMPERGAPERSAVGTAEQEAGSVRVQAARLDALMNQVGQLVVGRTRMDRKIEAFAELRQKLYFCRNRLAEIIQGFQERYEYNTGERRGRMFEPHPFGNGEEDQPQPKEDDFFTDLEFDKYDDLSILARSVIELASDTGEIADQLGGFIEAFAEESHQFSKITSALQRQITRMRLVPLDNVFRRLLRPVRDAARQEGKVVELHVEGADVQLDKAIVEALHAPLLHVVRNAVSHGIEPPAERNASGKPAAGTIRITATQRHNSVVLSVQDDGRGLDFEAIERKGRAAGLISSTARPHSDQLIPLIFQPGFSTDERVTDLSGRGVGMDIVARDIARLNGSVAVESRAGAGVTVRIALPIMTSIDEVVLLQTGTQYYALPVDFVEQAIAVHVPDLVEIDGQFMLKVRNELLPVLFLAPLAGEPAPSAAAVAVVLRAGERALALIVDQVQKQQEMVIRPLGRMLEGHPFLAGATLSRTGVVIFVLHIGRLFDALASAAVRRPVFILDESSDAAAIKAQAVLFVDDSISVRKLAARFLESEGMEADTAVDGIEALEKLASGRFRLVVTDLEMPRMHGYELIAEMRRHPQLSRLPVIVCTSRSGEKHRRRARDLGAQGYITKPFTKEQLVMEIQRLSGESTTAPAEPQGASIETL